MKIKKEKMIILELQKHLQRKRKNLLMKNLLNKNGNL
jgi:hypothetical protein